MGADSNDQEIVQTVLDGDPDAYSGLIRKYQARIRLVCLVFLGNKDEADDAAQDIFIKAYKGLRTFKGQASFQTWLLRISDNHCRDLLRSRKAHRAESLDALLAEKGDAMEGLLSRMAGARETPAYSAGDLEFLGRLFSALPSADREILALREVEELSYEEIAQRLTCSVDAVKGRLKRARATLTEKFQNILDTSAAPPRQ